MPRVLPGFYRPYREGPHSTKGHTPCKQFQVPVLDASGLHALKEFYARCKKEGSELILVEVQTQPSRLVRKFGLGHLIDAADKASRTN